MQVDRQTDTHTDRLQYFVGEAVTSCSSYQRLLVPQKFSDNCSDKDTDRKTMKNHITATNELSSIGANKKPGKTR